MATEFIMIDFLQSQVAGISLGIVWDTLQKKYKKEWLGVVVELRRWLVVADRTNSDGT